MDDVLIQEFIRVSLVVMTPLFLGVLGGAALSFVLQLITTVKEPVFLIPAQIAGFFMVFLLMSNSFFMVLKDFFQLVYSP